jgi:hypothetical protein
MRPTLAGLSVLCCCPAAAPWAAAPHNVSGKHGETHWVLHGVVNQNLLHQSRDLKSRPNAKHVWSGWACPVTICGHKWAQPGPFSLVLETVIRASHGHSQFFYRVARRECTGRNTWDAQPFENSKPMFKAHLKMLYNELVTVCRFLIFLDISWYVSQ